jgi:hypothetical protein
MLVGSIWVCGSNTTRLLVAAGWGGSHWAPLAALAGLCGRGRHRLDRWQEASGDATRRGAVTPPMAPRDNATAKTGRCIPNPNPA